MTVVAAYGMTIGNLARDPLPDMTDTYRASAFAIKALVVPPGPHDIARILRDKYAVPVTSAPLNARTYRAIEHKHGSLPAHDVSLPGMTAGV